MKKETTNIIKNLNESVENNSLEDINAYKDELRESLVELKNAWTRVSMVFGNIYHDCNDYIQDNYPFEQSFDDIGMYEWIDSTLENIENK